MFNRRVLLAVICCLVATTSTALAGGGTKKDSTIKVVNKLTNPVYAFVDVPAADISAAASSADPLAAFKKLGGKQIAAGNNSASFQVKTGTHKVTVVDLVEEMAVFTDRSVTTAKGKTLTLNVE